MIKRLLTNWINLLGYFFGFFLTTLFIAITQFIKNNKQISFESIIVDTFGGSILFAFGAIIYNIQVLILFLFFLLVLDFILLKKIGSNIELIIIIEILFFTLFFISISYFHHSYNFLPLILTFMLSQLLRKRKLTSLIG
jgi:hypothetical protein